MSERHAGYLVTLTTDVGEDSDQRIRDALAMVKGVLKVTPVPASYDLEIAQVRADAAWRTKLAEMVRAIIDFDTPR